MACFLKTLLCSALLLALSPLLAAAPAHFADLYLAPDGNDSAPGTLSQPMATLAAAVPKLRSLTTSSPKRILMRGGDYFDVCLTLIPADSGLTIDAAPGEKPVLHGGIRLTQWQKEGEKFVSFPLPPGHKWDIRLLQIDGQMRPRARFPQEGTLPHLTCFDVPWMSSTGGGWKRKPTPEELTTLQYKPGDIPGDLEVQNAEITIYHMWDESTVGIAANDAAQGLLTLSSETSHPAGAFGVKKYVLWNVRQGMLAPGNWFHDRAAGRIVYWPLPGEDLAKAKVVVPTVHSILQLSGTPKAPLKEVNVRNLHLTVTSVPLLSAGFAAKKFDGAVSMAFTDHCTLSGLTITQVAGHGIKASGTSCTIENSHVGFCGAGGIYAGGQSAVIRNNHVHDIGLCYPSAIGIHEGGQNCTVSHNLVHDCSYSAINYGGTGNTIEENEIHHCMKVLHDGAAIYLFASKNCVIRGNFAHDITDTGGYGASAYYLDERCQDCTLEGNLALNVAWPSQNHMATGNTLRNNVFITDSDLKITFPRSSGYTLEGNVLYATGKIHIRNIDAVTTWSRNLFYSQSGTVEAVNLQDYTETGTVEARRGDTLIADPLFTNRAQGDYTYQPHSPARALGLKPVEVKSAGNK